MLYFDYCASAPIHPKVNQLMSDITRDIFANPSSMHKFGLEANELVEESRKCISQILNVREEEVIFTSGATESNNLAILGTIRSLRKKSTKPLHVIVSETEHSSVYHCYKQLEAEGVEVSYLSVNSEGKVNTAAIEGQIKENTAMISIMHVNNETGTIQPIEEIGKILRKKSGIYFHVDGVQGFGKVPLCLDDIDLYTVSGHKIGGPKGTGILVAKERVELVSLFYGGGQEFGIRPGTSNVPGIVGITEAIKIVMTEREEKIDTLKKVHQTIYSRINLIPEITINSSKLPLSAPHILNFSYPGTTSAILLRILYKEGIIASSQSACSSKGNKASRVIMAMSNNEALASSSIRISWDDSIKFNDVELLIESIFKTVKEIRKMKDSRSVVRLF